MNDDLADSPPGEIADSRWHPEVEIKLAASPEALERLLLVPPLAFCDQAPVRGLESVYFDTAGRALQKAGIALRVRHDGDRHVQTLKVEDPAGGPHGRLERHDPVDGFRPRADVVRETAGPKFADMTDAELDPIFVTRIARRTMRAAPRHGQDGGSIEVAIDVGAVEAGDDREAVSEIELELVHGTVADLYDLALTLHRLEPLALEMRTKSERGYRLAGGRPPAWRKTSILTLPPGITLDAALVAVFGQCFDHWTGSQAAALDGRDIEGVHQMRVALRRLRAALGFFDAWLPAEQSGWLRRESKWLCKRLGAARDLDVLLAETLAPVRRSRGRSDRDLKLLIETVRERRDAAYARLVEALAAPRYTSLVLTLGAWIASAGWRDRGAPELEWPLVREVRTTLDGCHRDVMAAGSGFAGLDAVARHGLRLEIKRLRYALQFVGAAFGEAKPMLRLLGRLQDGLGAANDVAVAEDLLARAIGSRGNGRDRRRLAKASGLVAGWWLAHSEDGEQDLRATWAEFAAMAPFWHDERPALIVVAGGPPRT